MITPEQIYAAAKSAGDLAVQGAIDNYPCGFACLNIKPARGDFVKYLKSKNIGRKDDYFGGYTISSYECCAFNGQNMDVKEAGVRAFNAVLKQNGIVGNVLFWMD